MVPWPLPPVIAHRCGGALAPENTLAGLGIAAACGCAGVEFDVMLSADLQPLLIHDETLDRTTNGSGAVSACTLATMQRLDAGSWFDSRFAGERIPTLEAVLAACAALGLAVNLEIKPASGFERATAEVVASRLAAGAACGVPGLVISSFSVEALRVAMDILPEAIYGLLLEDLPADWSARASALGVGALHVSSRHLSPMQIASVRDGGYHLAVYTENDPVRAEALLKAGVSTVITDFPDRVRGRTVALK